MGFIALQSWSRGASASVHLLRPTHTWVVDQHLHTNPREAQAVRFYTVRASSSRKSLKKLKREAQQGKVITKNVDKKTVTEEEEEVAQVSSPKFKETQDTSISKDSIEVAPRDKVLQACTVTSGLMAALGLIMRTASHVAFTQGLPVPDCSADIQFGFETWHLGLITGLVILISSSRFLLLRSWPDFADSSEAANQQVTLLSSSDTRDNPSLPLMASLYSNHLQVLTSLEPLDYLVVAILPGISEEMFFRGAIMPLFGTNWVSIVSVGLVFGFLHLGSGRKYSFAVWASFVDIVYGYAAVLSSSLLVPMASHSLNNLVGGLLWRYSSKLKSLD